MSDFKAADPVVSAARAILNVNRGNYETGFMDMDGWDAMLCIVGIDG
jgi:hypothetical protein